MNRFRISTPEGTRDLLFSSCRALRQTENAVRDALEERGYSEKKSKTEEEIPFKFGNFEVLETL